MPRLANCFKAAVLCLLFSSATWAQEVKKDVDMLVASIDLMLFNQIETAFFLEDGVATLLNNEPNHHFHQARELYLNRSWERAAAEVRTAAALVGLEAVLSIEEADYESLLVSYYELLILSEDIAQEQVSSVAMLHRAFARAHRALAKTKLSKAIEYRDLGGRWRVGLNLRASVKNVEQWGVWADYEFSKEVQASFADARMTSRQLIDGEEFSSASVQLAFDMLAKQIKKLEQGINPARKLQQIEQRKKADEVKRNKRVEKRMKEKK